MKIIKYILGIILLLTLIFFAIGFIKPEVSYESEVSVNKPLNETWAVLSDEAKLPDWIEGYKRSELVSGEAGQVGAVSKIYVDNQGQEMVMQETITALDPDKRMAMTFTMDFMDMDYEVLLDEKEGKTHIRTKSKVKGNGMMAKSMVALMSSGMKAQENKNLSKLKKVIEENTKNYFPEPAVKAEMQETEE